jgi:hypothetical protein
VDTHAFGRENPLVLGAGFSRRQLTRTLSAAYGDGLISDETFSARLDEVLNGRVIDPRRLVGDLNFRASSSGVRARLSSTVNTMIGRLEDVFGDAETEAWTLLALDWTGERQELLLGRSRSCDVVLSELSVSRRHARLIFRDGKWVLQDLASTNGTLVNGRRVGRCELRPGDRVFIGEERLRID